MASIEITIPDQHVSRVVDAFANEYQYDVNKLNGETKAQFAKRMLIVFFKELVVRTEWREEQVTAYNDKKTNVDGISLS